jgi:hypothetical protein
MALNSNNSVSVLIAARNEPYLGQTIADVLAKARGDIEVIVVLDAYWPEHLPPEYSDHERVTIIHPGRNIGQRPAVNEAARIAKGKYIFKLDAHCMVDEGFDVKLAADCEYDWTVIPRMYQLDAEHWKPKLGKKTDFMFFRAPDADEHPFRIDYYDGRIAHKFCEEYRAYKNATWRQGDICDTMTCIGAGWFMHRDRFWELGGMDEEHGHWGQMGVELSCKTWLSGGRMVVNKKTWFAHLWRGHAPWKLTQKQVDKAREYSKDLWLSGKWPLQKRPLSWLIEKFAPVPTWADYQFNEPKTKGEPINPQNTGDLTLLYYTANRIDETFRDKVIAQLQYASPNTLVITVSQKPMGSDDDIGYNICVGEIGASLQNIYKQVLAGLREVKTEYVALVEDDCLYVPEHFTFRPTHIAYNLNRWLLHADSEHVFSYRRRPILSQCIAPTKLLLECLQQREGKDIPKKYSGEPGLFEGKLGLKEYPYETFETKEPNVVVCHNKNTSGRKYLGKDAEPRSELPPWGRAWDLLMALGLIEGRDNSSTPSISSGTMEDETNEESHDKEDEEQNMAKFGRGSWKRWQHSYIGSIIFGMDEIMGQLMNFADRRRPGRAERRMKTLPPFVERIANQELSSPFEEQQLRDDPWFAYLCELYPTWRKSKREARVLQIMRETVKLFHDIKENGLKSPLDMWREGKDRLILHRGWRRLIIMHELHKRGLRDFSRVPVRVFKSKAIFQKYAPSPKWAEGPVDDNSIHGLAMKQFCERGIYATDKYWVHGYIRQYDRHFAHLRDKPVKLLEIGVFRGASLLLWKEAFPKGQIFGLDKNTAIWQKFLKGQQRIHVFVGKQEDESFLKAQVIPAGPYDIIVDDGGHTPEEQLASFNQLWPHLAPGGIYVIEDMHGNYWEKRAKNGPLMAERIKAMIDETVGTNDCLDYQSLAVYYNIAFIEKNR